MTVMYSLWNNMINRCTNPSLPRWKHYGGRGITVCDRWLNDFDAFCNDIGAHPGKGWTLDREDNDGHYEPGNVRWATQIAQIHNSRTIRLTRANIQEARAMRDSGAAYQAIADHIGVHVTTIHRALTGVTWKQ